MPYALVLFIAMPIIEIALLLRIGSAIGWVSTLLIVIATAFLGAAMLRQQGLATLNTARHRMDSGELPAQQLLEGVLIMIGGVLLLTPGFVTDAFGFSCLIPASRRWLAQRLSRHAIVGSAGMAGGVHSSGSGQVYESADHYSDSRTEKIRKKTDDGQIIDGDFQRIDD